MMIVIGEDNFHSVSCSTCGYGVAGKGILPEQYVTKLIEGGYIRQLAKKAAGLEDLTRFFTHEIKSHRSAAEMAGDMLERHEVSFR
jgi:hypothetical protein